MGAGQTTCGFPAVAQTCRRSFGHSQCSGVAASILHTTCEVVEDMRAVNYGEDEAVYINSEGAGCGSTKMRPPETPRGLRECRKVRHNIGEVGDGAARCLDDDPTLGVDRFTGGDGDEVEVVRSQRRVVLPGCPGDVVVWVTSEAIQGTEISPDGVREWSLRHSDSDAIEMRARRSPLAEGTADVRMTVLGNDVVRIASDVVLPSSWRQFRFAWVHNLPLWTVTLEFTVDTQSADRTADGSEERLSAKHGGCVAQVDPDFGVRFRGSDLLQTAAARHPCNGQLLSRGALSGCGGGPRGGNFPAFVPHSLGTSLELVVCGMSGHEVVDVYVNGFSVACQQGLHLSVPGEHQLLEYFLGPVSAPVRNVLVRVARAEGAPRATLEAEFGVLVDPGFGFTVCGNDCLSSAAFIGVEGLVRSSAHDPVASANCGRQLAVMRGSCGWPRAALSGPSGCHRGDLRPREEDDAQAVVRAAEVSNGAWLREGWYRLLPYRRSIKPRSPDVVEFPST